MDHIGIDLHQRDSQIYILAEGGEVIERRIRTEPERFDAALGTRFRARVLIEASTDSWSRLRPRREYHRVVPRHARRARLTTVGRARTVAACQSKGGFATWTSPASAAK